MKILFIALAITVTSAFETSSYDMFEGKSK